MAEAPQTLETGSFVQSGADDLEAAVLVAERALEEAEALAGAAAQQLLVARVRLRAVRAAEREATAHAKAPLAELLLRRGELAGLPAPPLIRAPPEPPVTAPPDAPELVVAPPAVGETWWDAQDRIQRARFVECFGPVLRDIVSLGGDIASATSPARGSGTPGPWQWLGVRASAAAVRENPGGGSSGTTPGHPDAW